MIDLIATYRLQLGPEFGFTEVRQLIAYFDNLGVSHLYLSPIWQARPGSTHGYDVVDPTRVSSELGGEANFIELAKENLGIILDVVPNHMAADASNPYWTDEQLRGKFFDIDSVSGFHRRFFDVDELIGVRVEDREVFDVTHRKVRELVGLGLVDGLRIDHIDGLADPDTYLQRLSHFGVSHVWVEKILEPGEQLRQWPVDGTTGYDFMSDVTSLFVEPTSRQKLTELTGEHRSFAEIAFEAKFEQVMTTFTPEVNRLQTLINLPDVAPALGSLSVYRTYCNPSKGILDDADRAAVAQLPGPIRSVFTNTTSESSEFITRFQQTTGAVMAKGVEDTALYRYVRLLALNDVGGDPQRFGLSVEDFHLANLRRAKRSPNTLLTSQTHDTKRSGDVRSRLVALSYVVDDWVQAVHQWHELNAKWKRSNSPDWTEELFIYQTMIGGWPIGLDRLALYLRKALREAKRNTNWIEPDERWENDAIAFCSDLMVDQKFLSTFQPFAERIALVGERISLAQLVLRLSVPGIPDIYQGDESWNFSFVDPDNRRPIDWKAVTANLDDLCSRRGVIERKHAKLFVTKTMLDLRKRHLQTFQTSYLPLYTSETTCAYQRGQDVIVAVAVRGEPITFDLPKGSWTNVLEPLEGIYPPASAAVYERGDR